MPTLVSMAEAVGALLKARNEAVAVSELSMGGLIAAALLAVPGASAYFVGGGVIYTHKAREALLEAHLEDHPGMRASTEPYALLCATAIRERLGATWASARRARPGPRATATAMRPVTAASRCQVGAPGASPWRPGSRIARAICGALRARPSTCSSRFSQRLRRAPATVSLTIKIQQLRAVIPERAASPPGSSSRSIGGRGAAVWGMSGAKGRTRCGDLDLAPPLVPTHDVADDQAPAGAAAE